MGDRFFCRACRSSDVARVLDLGAVPGSDTFPAVDDPGPDQTWPLHLYFCSSCTLAQLGPAGPTAVDEQGAAESATARAHAKESAEAILAAEQLGPGGTIIEIDSGHGGSWLPHFVSAGLRAQPRHGTADVVIDLHGLMHEPDLDAAAADHARRLRAGGRLICEFYYLGSLAQGSLIDTIRHGHFHYLSLTAISALLARHGLVVGRAQYVAMFGGSMRITAWPAADDRAVDESVCSVREAERTAGLDRVSTFAELDRRGRAAAKALRTHLTRAAEHGTAVAGYGAPSKAAVLLALAAVDSSLLPYTVDISPAKHGRRIPGAHVPVMPVETLLSERPAEVVVLTWDIADEVAAQLRDLASGTGWRPRLWVPLPEPGYLT